MKTFVIAMLVVSGSAGGARAEDCVDLSGTYEIPEDGCLAGLALPGIAGVREVPAGSRFELRQSGCGRLEYRTSEEGDVEEQPWYEATLAPAAGRWHEYDEGVLVRHRWVRRGLEYRHRERGWGPDCGTLPPFSCFSWNAGRRETLTLTFSPDGNTLLSAYRLRWAHDFRFTREDRECVAHRVKSPLSEDPPENS